MRFRDRQAEWSHFRPLANVTPRRSATGLPISEDSPAGSSLGIASVIITLGTITRPRRCGGGAATTGGVVSGHSQRTVERQSARSYWADSICNEYGTAMALIILQIPNSYLRIVRR